MPGIQELFGNFKANTDTDQILIRLLACCNESGADNAAIIALLQQIADNTDDLEALVIATNAILT